MASNCRPAPHVDEAIEHTCGTLYRAGVITRNCPACQHTNAWLAAAPARTAPTPCAFLVGGIPAFGNSAIARTLLLAGNTEPEAPR